MGMLDRIFGEPTEREQLIARAELVGTLEDVIEMGILCAQLGLTPDDVQKLARLYVKGTHWNES